MYWCDLDVLSDLGFPNTAQRIRNELEKSYNSDNLIQWAWDNGFSVEKYDGLWIVKRTQAPYSDNISWSDKIFKIALDKAIKETGYMI